MKKYLCKNASARLTYRETFNKFRKRPATITKQEDETIIKEFKMMEQAFKNLRSIEEAMKVAKNLTIAKSKYKKIAVEEVAISLVKNKAEASLIKYILDRRSTQSDEEIMSIAALKADYLSSLPVNKVKAQPNSTPYQYTIICHETGEIFQTNALNLI